MPETNGAQLLVECLQEAGVTAAFGMAGHTNIALLDALVDSRIRYYSVRHEQVAAHAADAYFRVNRRPAALILHVGPGVANAMTGFGDAMADGSAIVAIAGDVASFHQGKDAFQEVSLHADAGQWEIARPLSKQAWKITSIEGLLRHVPTTIRLAQAGRPGPVLLSVAMDVFSARTSRDCARPASLSATMAGTGTHESIIQAAAMLGAAVRPVIVAGGGALGARSEITTLLELTGAPLVTTLSGRTTVDEFHPQCLGPIGRTGSAAANRATAEADVLLAVGTQFPEQDSSSWVHGKTFSIPPCRLIQVDIDVNQIGKIFPVALGVVADAKAAMASLAEAIQSGSSGGTARSRIGCADSAWLVTLREEHLAWRRQHVESVSHGADRAIHPGFLLQELALVIPDTAIVLGDVGWGKNGTSQFIRRTQLRTMLVASGFGTMGWSAAAALGAKVAKPDTMVVSITGDGGMSSCLSALMTAAEYGIAATWVVLNNGVYQSIMGLQQQHFARTHGTVFGGNTPATHRTDFAALARGCGMEARTVASASALREALHWATTCGRPALLDVLTDPKAFPPSSGFWDVHEIYAGGAAAGGH